MLIEHAAPRVEFRNYKLLSSFAGASSRDFMGFQHLDTTPHHPHPTPTQPPEVSHGEGMRIVREREFDWGERLPSERADADGCVELAEDGGGGAVSWGGSGTR